MDSRTGSQDASIVVPPSPDACRFISENTATNCSTYRPCASCLTKHGCHISTEGYCAPEADSYHDQLHDYRRAFQLNLTLPDAARDSNNSQLEQLQSWEFHTGDVSYCPSSDATCQQCIQAKYWQSAGRIVDSRFCVGANGCVCVANCAFSENNTYCFTKSSPDEQQNSMDDTSRGVTIVYSMVLAVFVLTLCVGVSCCSRSRRKRRAQKATQELAVDQAHLD